MALDKLFAQGLLKQDADNNVIIAGPSEDVAKALAESKAAQEELEKQKRRQAREWGQGQFEIGEAEQADDQMPEEDAFE